VWQRKQSLLPPEIQYITCSDWLASVASSSGLLKNASVLSIPNPIDTDVFQPMSETERLAYRVEKGISPGSHLLLFAAMKVSETRKGFHFLLEALNILKAQHPDFQLEILVLGKADPDALSSLPFPVHALGLIHDVKSLSRAYGAADLFAIPSLEDNLPNTVMESLACGTPVVGFDTGGIPQMVGHLKEGFIAPQGDSQKLAEGFYEVLEGSIPARHFRTSARQKVEANYANSVIARRYMEVYEQKIKPF
jgi:glycosyltransferase involved in cell wall biosynthesis